MSTLSGLPSAEAVMVMAVQPPQTESVLLHPAEGLVTSLFGERENPVLGTEEFHNGIDIALIENTPLVAVADGVITEIRNSTTYGLMVYYETKNDFQVMYAHLNEVLFDVGEVVEKGTVIAKSGNTGLSTGPHLHYSLWKNGELQDPLLYVSLDLTAEAMAEYKGGI
ncbi:MAG: M23 family metallopeptidase [Bacillota bacterium]